MKALFPDNSTIMFALSANQRVLPNHIGHVVPQFNYNNIIAITYSTKGELLSVVSALHPNDTYENPKYK